MNRGPARPNQPAESNDEDGPRKINETKFRVEFIWQPREGQPPEADPYALPEENADGENAAEDGE